jgi:putative membrane protein
MSATFWKISFQYMLLSAALIAGDWFFDDVEITSNWAVLITAAVIMLLNQFIKPLIVLLTLPATIFTFGLFLLIVNAMVLLITSQIVPEFQLQGFGAAFWLSIFIGFIQLLFGQNAKVKVQVHKEDQFDDYEEVQ